LYKESNEKETAESVKAGKIYVSKKRKGNKVFVTHIGQEYAEGIGDYYFVCFYYMDDPDTSHEINPYMFLNQFEEYI